MYSVQMPGFVLAQIWDGLFLQSGLFCYHSGKEALAHFLRKKQLVGCIVALPNVDTQQPNYPLTNPITRGVQQRCLLCPTIPC
jgi:hypothetical protein